MSYRNPKDTKLSKEGGFLLQHNNPYFEEYYHGLENIKGIEDKGGGIIYIESV